MQRSQVAFSGCQHFFYFVNFHFCLSQFLDRGLIVCFFVLCFFFFFGFFYIFFGSATYTKMPKGFLGNKRKPVITILSVAVPLFLASLVAFTWLMKKRKRKDYKIASIDFSLESNDLKDSSRHLDLLIFYLSCIVAARDERRILSRGGQR